MRKVQSRPSFQGVNYLLLDPQMPRLFHYTGPFLCIKSSHLKAYQEDILSWFTTSGLIRMRLCCHFTHAHPSLAPSYTWGLTTSLQLPLMQGEREYIGTISKTLWRALHQVHSGQINFSLGFWQPEHMLNMTIYNDIYLFKEGMGWNRGISG